LVLDCSNTFTRAETFCGPGIEKADTRAEYRGKLRTESRAPGPWYIAIGLIPLSLNRKLSVWHNLLNFLTPKYFSHTENTSFAAKVGPEIHLNMPEITVSYVILLMQKTLQGFRKKGK